MALTTLYLQRRDQRRVVLCEVKASVDVVEDSHKGAETIDSEKQAQTEITPM
jgi:anti-sigma factor ChrR (cupin superfamily)